MSIYIYIYLYICLYIYLYISIYILKKDWNVLAFFCTRTKRSRVLFRSLQKNFAFFSVLCKRMLRSLRSFGSHKSPKTRIKNGKEQNFPFKERKRTERTEWKRKRCPTLPFAFPTAFFWFILASMQHTL